MNARGNQEVVSNQQDLSFRRWSSAANILLFAGAAASLAFTLYAGRHNKSVLLVSMFAVWVLLPFIGLFASDRASRSVPGRGRISLLVATAIISVCSVIIYGAEALGPRRANAAFFFLVVPAVSWLVIGADYVIALRRSRG